MTNVVLVAGPGLAGTSSVVAALQGRLPECRVIEERTAGKAADVVVFVVSATAPLTESDCALLDAAAADTDAVIGVVSKIDVHRTWRAVLDADRTALTEWSGRYGGVLWVGAAAAPDIGSPSVDELVATVRIALADDSLDHRNRLRAWENRLAVLREQRSEAVRRFQLDKSRRTIAVRSQLQHARVQLLSFARTRCATVRAELHDDVATMSRRRLASFADDVRRRVAEVSDDVQENTTRQLSELAADVPVPAHPLAEVDVAPPRSRGAETRLMMLLGAGFGLGVALTVSRVFADLAPQWAIAGSLAGAAVGLAVTLWVIGVRGLLHERAVLDRWMVEVVTGLRTAMEEWVAIRVVAAEAAVGRAAAERDAADSAEMAEIVARIDSEIREHAAQRARAVAIADRRVPVIESGLVGVRMDINERNR